MSVPWYVKQLGDFAGGGFNAGKAWNNRPTSWGDQYRSRGLAANEVNNWYLAERARQMGGQVRPADLGIPYTPPAQPAATRTQPMPTPVPTPSPGPLPPLSKYNMVGGQGAYPPTGALNIQTSIQPGLLYTPGMSQLAVNQAAAKAQESASLPYLLNQMARPGMRATSPAMLAKAAVPMGQAQADARIAQQVIPFQDQMANLNFLLQGQQAREQEALGLADLGLRQRDLQRNNDLSNRMSLLGLLTQFA